MTTTTIEKAMRLDDYDLPAFISKSADEGEVTKAELGELLNRRVAKQRRPEESFAQAYARCLVEGHDVTGKQLFRTYMAAQGPDEHQAAARKALEDEVFTKHDPSTSATPLQKLEALAEQVRHGTSMTKEQAFAKAMVTPAGMALYKADKLERLGLM